jgi:hypothetical protein
LPLCPWLSPVSLRLPELGSSPCSEQGLSASALFVQHPVMLAPREGLQPPPDVGRAGPLRQNLPWVRGHPVCCRGSGSIPASTHSQPSHLSVNSSRLTGCQPSPPAKVKSRLLSCRLAPPRQADAGPRLSPWPSSSTSGRHLNAPCPSPPLQGCPHGALGSTHPVIHSSGSHTQAQIPAFTLCMAQSRS